MKKLLNWFYSSYDEKRYLLNSLNNKTKALEISELRALNQVLKNYKLRDYGTVKLDDLDKVVSAYDVNIEDCCFSLYQLKKIIEFVN